jgi:hypothetical protein
MPKRDGIMRDGSVVRLANRLNAQVVRWVAFWHLWHIAPNNGWSVWDGLL